MNKFQNLISQEWFEVWPQYQWFSNFILKHFVEICYLVESTNASNLLIRMSTRIFEVFGHNYVKQNVVPLFEVKLGSLGTTPDLSDNPLSKNFITIFSLGVLKLVETPLDHCAIIKKWILVQILSNQSVQYISPILQSLIQDPRYFEDLSELVWSLVVHQSPKIR